MTGRTSVNTSEQWQLWRRLGVLIALCGAAALTAQAQTCPAGGTNALAPYDNQSPSQTAINSNNVYVGNSRLQVAHQAVSATITQNVINDAHIPGDIGVRIGHDETATNATTDYIESTYAFHDPANLGIHLPVANLTFRLHDIDAADNIIVSAYVAGSATPIALTSAMYSFDTSDGSNNASYAGSNRFTSVSTFDAPNNRRGTIHFNFAGYAIERVVLRYYDAAGAGTYTTAGWTACTPSLTLYKTTVGGSGGAFGFTLTNTGRNTGSTVSTTAADTPTQVDGSTAPGMQGFLITAPGSQITLTENALLPADWTFTGTICRNAAGTTVGFASGATYTIPGAATGAGAAIACTVTNTYTPPPPFICDAKMYLSQANSLYTVDRSTNPFVYTALGAAGSHINAMGYNPANNYLYAMRNGTGVFNELIRIAADGSQTSLGAVTGLPSTTAFHAGGFTTANDNMLYVIPTGDAGTMYRVNVVTLTATAVTLAGGPVRVLDIAFRNGLFYAFEVGATAGANTRLVSISPTGTVTRIGGAHPTGSFGAMYADSNGIYGVLNGGGFYQFDALTGARTLISSSNPADSNDGASCPTAGMTFPADLAITKNDGSPVYAPGSNVIYTVMVSNNGPFGAQNARVRDALPPGITTATWTCTAANGAVCRTTGGSGAIDALVDLPHNMSGAAATATFVLTLAVPSTFTGDLVNTATVTAGVGTTDGNAANNSATDTDAPAVTDLSIQKTATPNPVVSGSQVVFSLVVTNHGPAAADGATVLDPAVAGLDCVAAGLPAPTCAATGGASCPSPLTGVGLQAGVVIPALPNGGVVTLGLTCRATATGLP